MVSTREELVGLLASDERWRPTWHDGCAQFVVEHGDELLALVEAADALRRLEPRFHASGRDALFAAVLPLVKDSA